MQTPPFPQLPCRIQHLLAAAVISVTVTADIVLQAQFRNVTLIATIHKLNGIAAQLKSLNKLQ